MDKIIFQGHTESDPDSRLIFPASSSTIYRVDGTHRFFCGNSSKNFYGDLKNFLLNMSQKCPRKHLSPVLNFYRILFLNCLKPQIGQVQQ